MNVRNLALAAGSIGLAAAFSPAAFAQGYNPQASAQAAQDFAQNASTQAPQVAASDALNPAGPTTVASQPVPDTAANRAQFGQPLSRAGKRTAPIGD